MTQDNELADLIQSIVKKSFNLITNINEKNTPFTLLMNQYVDLTEYYQNLIQVFLQNPQKIMEMQQAYWKEAFDLTYSLFTSLGDNQALPLSDSRFSKEPWLEYPFFNLLSQQYLLISKHINRLFETMEYSDTKQAKRLQFATKQYLDALSPANFIPTNPQILAETIESKGENLLKGFHHFLSDLEQDSSNLMIKMSDTESYKLGEHLAITPGKVVFRNAMMELIQYTPQTKTVKSIPLLIIPPWINKYYILDLSPHNSLVNWLVGQGISVFIISWVNPDASFAKKGLFEYLQEGPRTAIDVIKEQLGVEQVNTLGFCIGGTLLAILLAYNKKHKDKSIRSATFLASMIDFSEPGDISVFIDEQQIKKLEEEMRVKGYLAGKFMASSFNMLRANDLIWSFYVKNYLRGKNPIPFDILYWNADSTNMPAKMHSEYLRWMYLNNNLVKPGKIRLNKTPIEVQLIDIPTFFLATEKDHIAPWKSIYAGFQLMHGEKRFVLGGSGHIAGIVNAPAAKKYTYRTNRKQADSAQEWFEHSKVHSSSWWPEWFKWLDAHSGKAITAPEWGQLPFGSLMDAPGSYVFKK